MWWAKHLDIDSWAQDCSNFIANALGLLQSYAKPSILFRTHNTGWTQSQLQKKKNTKNNNTTLSVHLHKLVHCMSNGTGTQCQPIRNQSGKRGIDIFVWEKSAGTSGWNHRDVPGGCQEAHWLTYYAAADSNDAIQVWRLRPGFNCRLETWHWSIERGFVWEVSHTTLIDNNLWLQDFCYMNTNWAFQQSFCLHAFRIDWKCDNDQVLVLLALVSQLISRLISAEVLV